MRFTVGWLKEYLDFDSSIDELCNKLTSIGLEVENVNNPKDKLEKFVVSTISEVKDHPNADKLKVCKVNDGKNFHEIVCGAKNVHEGMITVLAKIGAIIYPSSNKEFKITKNKIRGIQSNGMLCSPQELGFSDESDGIIELDKNYIIGESFSQYIEDDETDIEIAITPNRVDCAGVYGIARDLSASGLGKQKELRIKKHNSSYKTKFKVNNMISDSDCPKFLIREVRDLKNGVSSEFIVKRFNKTGIKVISSLVDITNYINIDYCRPLHVFDSDKLCGDITIRHSKKGERFTGLDDQEYVLDNNMIVICDDEKIISLAGILGAKNSGCDENTTNVLIESAYFLPESISSTGRKLNIQSDARYRFERGIDPLSTKDGIEMATDMIKKTCGGEIGTIVNETISTEKSPEINITLEFLNKLLGTNLKKEIFIQSLTKIGCKLKEKDGIFFVSPPSWRQDISLKEDLVEEVARLFGYDNIESTPLNFNKKNYEVTNIEQKSKKKIREILVSRGVTETINWSFVNQKWEDILKTSYKKVLLENPISTDLSVLRTNLVGGLLNILKNNNNKGLKNISIFEIGPIFFEEKLVDQSENVVVMRSGKAVEKNWIEKNRDFDVFDLKSDLIAIFEIINLDSSKIDFSNSANSYYHPGKNCSIKFGNKTIGSLGQIHPQIIKDFGLKNNVSMLEINFSKLKDFLKDKSDSRKEFKKLSFQSSIRDFSFSIDKTISSGEVVNFIKSLDKELIRTVKVFDDYSDDSQNRAIAIEVKIQSEVKTLSELEINKVCQEIVKKIEEKFSAKLR